MVASARQEHDSINFTFLLHPITVWYKTKTMINQRKIYEFFCPFLKEMKTYGSHREWQKSCRKRFPIRTFLLWSLPCWYEYRFRKFFTNIKWWFLHRTFYRYTSVKCHGLKPGYYDVDTQMLHACFGLLVNYVEHEAAWSFEIGKYRYHFWELWKPRFKKSREKGIAWLAWQYKASGEKPWEGAEDREPDPNLLLIIDLYNWWTERYLKFDSKTYYKSDGTFDGDAYCTESDKLDKEADEMLAKLTNVRNYLWT